MHAWHNGDIIYNRFLKLLLLFLYVPSKRTSKRYISVFTLDGQGFCGSLFMKSDFGWVILVIIKVLPLDLPAMMYWRVTTLSFYPTYIYL